MRSNQVVTVGVEGRRLTFTVVGAVGGAITLDANGLSAEVREQAMIHGLVQKVRDAAAIQRALVNGVETKATPNHKRDAMGRVVEALVAGRWNAERVGGGRIGADETILSRAMAELYEGKTNKAGVLMDADWIRAKVTGMTAEERRGMLLVPAIKEVADRLRAEAAQGVDTESLLDDFE